tara:strand:- start:402 stop:581 length:180 start_codon:yes stop_codon:yes gene_type:complete
MTKQWEVIIFETVRHSTTVEADNRDEAYDKAYKVISEGYNDTYETEAEGYTGDWDAYEL